MSHPRFAVIKNHILAQIERGLWLPGDKVPSENQLGSQFEVSRMTARRALNELAEDGILVRNRGAGSFVADTKPMSSLLKIRNIAEEIRSRGHHHHCVTLCLQRVAAGAHQAMALSVTPGSSLFRSVLVHFENGTALQYEDRYVNPALAPGYLEQDFQRQTPNAYLSEVAPLTEADHVVEAVCPDQMIAEALAIDTRDPCLKVSRRTWSRRGVVSLAYLYHPGNRYRLGGHLNLTSVGEKPTRTRVKNQPERE